jgi:hypothetical protein
LGLDENGNRIRVARCSESVPTAGSVSYTYNAKRNRLSSAGSDTFTYDNEGQLDTGYGTSYSFDYEHRLTGIGSNYQFYYDGSNNRLEAGRCAIGVKSLLLT